MKIWIIIAIVIVIGVAVFLFWKRSETKKQEEAERGVFGGRTRAELTEELKAAWKQKHHESTVNYILTEQEPDTWKQAIIAEAAKQGDTTPIADLAEKQAIIAWAKDNPKANDTAWGKQFLWVYIHNNVDMSPNSAEAADIMSGI